MSTYKKHYNRVLEISDDYKQITMPDGRFYQRNGDYYPSVTWVLSHYPKGKFFEDCLKKVGYASGLNKVFYTSLLITGRSRSLFKVILSQYDKYFTNSTETL